jgi:hypothetical protein
VFFVEDGIQELSIVLGWHLASVEQFLLFVQRTIPEVRIDNEV